MYKTFFGLRENPFNVNPDPRFLYLTPQTRAAMDELTYGIQNRKGFILLTGEVGTGKTTLINYLLNWLRTRKTPTAFIFNSHLTPNHLFDFILTDFGIPVDYRLNNNMLMRLNTWLIERFRAGETPVLIIDEAQGLSSELLEEIRLLLNLETASEKLLQIVLVGQPELEQKLRRPELRQLQQRITLRCNTGILSVAQTHGYIAERLRIAGAVGAPIFASEAMDAVHFYSQGIPRVSNLLCEHALINAYVEHSRVVFARMVDDAAHEFLLDDGKSLSLRRNSPELVNNNLGVMHTIFATALSSPQRVEKTKQPLPTPVPATTSVATAVAVPVAPRAESSAFKANDNRAATVQLWEPISVSKEKTIEGFSAQELIPVIAASQKKQASSALPENSNSSAAEPAVFQAADERSQAKVLPIPVIAVNEPRMEGAPAATASIPIAIAEKRGATRAGGKQVPHKVFRTGVQAQAASSELRSSQWSKKALAHTAVLKLLSSMLLLRAVLGCWARDFRRDWMVMIRATPVPAMKDSLLRWLGQPIRSTEWKPAKVTTLQARRDAAP